MTTKPKRPSPKRAPKRETNGRRSLTPLDPSRPIGDRNPPVETQFQLGNKAAVGHIRPQKIEELRKLIIETMAEDITDERGRFVMTRAQAMIRTMLVKSPTDRIALLEYAFGKVPQQISIDIVQQIAAELRITPAEAEAKVQQAAEILVSRPEFEAILTGLIKTDELQPRD